MGRRHNAHVKQVSPKDKFLLFNLADGWEPLCKLLEKPIPSVPFPHLNKWGSKGVIETVLSHHPVAKSLQREAQAVFGVLAGASFYLIYHFFTNSANDFFIFRYILL